jgi:hypothetical protein
MNAHGVMFQKVAILIQKKVDRLRMKQLNHDGAHLAATVTGILQLVLPVFLQPPSFPVKSCTPRPPAACWLGHPVQPVQALEAPPYGVPSPLSVSFKSPCRPKTGAGHSSTYSSSVYISPTVYRRLLLLVLLLNFSYSNPQL